MSDETVVGDRRNVKKHDDLEVIGPKRDAAKVWQVKRDDIALDIAAPRRSASGSETKSARRRSVPSKGRGFSLLVIAALILIAATLSAFFLLERYQPVGAVLLADPPFSEGFDGWKQQGSVTFDPSEPGAVTLLNDNPESRTFLKRTIELPPWPVSAFLEATVSTVGVVAGEKIWQRARIYLAQLDEAGETDWTKPHNLFRLRGTKSTRTISQVFPMPASISQASLALELNNAAGRMVVSDLKLYPVEEQQLFRQVSTVLMAGWGVLVVIAAIMIFGNIPSTMIRLALGSVVGLFLVGLFMPISIHDALIDAFRVPSGGEGGIELDVVGHGAFFAIMAFLVRLGRPADAIWLHLGCWVLVAVASEVLQLFTFDREPSVADLLADGAGFVLGLTLAQFLPRVFSGLALSPAR